MRITFDTDVDALTVVLTSESVARTVEAGDGRLIDLDDQGKVVAFEIIGVSEGFHLHDLAESYDLEPIFMELGQRVRDAREGLRSDPLVREAMSAR